MQIYGFDRPNAKINFSREELNLLINQSLTTKVFHDDWHNEL
jgi:hypothetical protein